MEDIKYKIIELHPERHQIVVRFFTDTYGERHPGMVVDDREEHRLADGSPSRCQADRAIDLPIPTPSDDEVDKIIAEAAEGVKPFFAWLASEDARAAKIADPSVDTSMKRLLTRLHAVKPVAPRAAAVAPVMAVPHFSDKR